MTIRSAPFVKELGIFGLVVTTGEDFAWYLGYVWPHLIMNGGHLDLSTMVMEIFQLFGRIYLGKDLSQKKNLGKDI